MAKRQSAYSRVLKEAQQQQSGETVSPSQGETEKPYYRETEERLYSNTVIQQERETVEQFEKTTFYLTAEQSEKLDDLAHDHKKQTGQKINRNDIVRYLIDQATLESLAGIKRHVKRSATHPQEQPNKSDIEERFRTDTQVHQFKKWLRTHDQPQDTDFAKRFLADSRLPQHASRGLYEAKMRSTGYSDEDIHLFHDAWKRMLTEDQE